MKRFLVFALAMVALMVFSASDGFSRDWRGKRTPVKKEMPAPPQRPDRNPYFNRAPQGNPNQYYRSNSYRHEKQQGPRHEGWHYNKHDKNPYDPNKRW